MRIADQPLPIVWGHWTEGGTGVTNIGADIEARRERYMQAAQNVGFGGITIINRTVDGREGWSLHDCQRHSDLSPFWDEVRRLGGY